MGWLWAVEFSGWLNLVVTIQVMERYDTRLKIFGFVVVVYQCSMLHSMTMRKRNCLTLHIRTH